VLKQKFFGKISPPYKVHRMKFLRCCNTDLWGDDRAIRASSDRKPTSHFGRNHET
jgi:hypothetical protein